MKLKVSSSVLQAMLEAAARAAPSEACGLLMGRAGTIDRFHVASNIHAQPRTHFEIDPQVLVDAFRAERVGGPQVVGYFHSHPAGPPEPSATDREMAAHDQKIWAIAGRGQIAFWRDMRDKFEPICYEPVNG